MKKHAKRVIHFSERSVISCNQSNPLDHAAADVRGKYTRIVFLMAIVLFLMPRAVTGATTGRFWTYFNLAVPINPSWTVVVMPGLRYEFARTDDPMVNPNKKFYFYELFTGPTFARTWGAFTLKLPVWYYYMGFPSPDAYAYSHNIEFLPIINYRMTRLSLTSRTIFHNTVYASVYEPNDQKSGYSLVIRQLLDITFALNERLAFSLAEEPFFGMIEDNEAPPSPIGFWPQGFGLNRVYIGFRYQITPLIAVSPQYVFETAYDEGHVTETNHYLFITFSSTLRILQ